MRVIVIGGGIMGCATARELARRGVEEVIVLERAVPGAEASSAAAGILGAQIELRAGGPMLETLARARDGYRAWTEALREETGLDCGWRASGALVACEDDEEAERFGALVRAHVGAGLHAELVDGARARDIEPELSTQVRHAAWLPDEAQVDPPALLRALAASLPRRRGVKVESGVTVDRILVENGRCAGVRCLVEDARHGDSGASDVREVRGDAVVLAAGSWSARLAGVDAALGPSDVKPARGQMVLLDERPPKLRTIVSAGETYAVPRGDGRVLCGSTVEFVGFRREVTAGGVRAILDGTLAAVPSLASAQLASTWSSFRPYAPSDVPLVGVSKLPGLFLATGHHKNGILLAPTTAERVAAAILG